MLITTDRLQYAAARSLMRTVWFITTEPVRALITTLATACEGPSVVEVFDAGRGNRRLCRMATARTMDHAGVQRLRGAEAEAG